VVSRLKFNEQVKNVLRRKLYSYINWKDKTERELKNRFQFTLRYLRQHWGTIKMYMAWVKPYLKNVQRLRMSQGAIQSVDIVSAFETAVTEIEVLAKKPPKKGVYPCVLISIRYVTQPELSYHQEGYAHRGPLHVGELEFQLRAYAWTKQDIESFKRLKNEEDMELLRLVDESVSAAMDALGDDLNKFLEEAGEKLEKKEEHAHKPRKKKQPVSEVISPFTAVFKGFAELFGLFFNPKGFFSKKPSSSSQSVKEKAAKAMIVPMYLTYKNYKKSHGMLAW